MRTLVRRVVLIAAMLAGPAAHAQPALTRSSNLAGAPARGAIALEAGQGRIVTLPGVVANVFVADPKVVEVRPASATTLFVFGSGPGRTTVAALNAEGRSVALYEVTVRASGFAASEASRIVGGLPGQSLRVTQAANGLNLQGTVEAPEQAYQAERAARAQIPSSQTVQNTTRTRQPIQVQLQVRIAEMSRTVTRDFGINWSAFGQVGRYAITAATGYGLAGQGLNVIGGAYSGNGANIDTVLQALANDNLSRLLAEPNLTALSGDAASFLVGGEFPIPISQGGGQSSNNAITVEFKQYGIGLTFVPTVLDDSRINLRLRSEVSALTSQGAVQVNGLTIQALTVRRAETSVELGSGEAMVIAGLLQDNVTEATSALPWIGEIPVIGALFRSESFLRQKTELVIIVTPVLVQPVRHPNDLSLPTDNNPVPNEAERILLLRQIGGGPPMPLPVRLPGNAGFIVQ